MRSLQLFALLALSGCASIIGLDERELLDGSVDSSTLIDAPMGGDGGADPSATGPLTCENYCARAQTRCVSRDNKGDTKPLLYQQDETYCIAACEKFPVGDLANPTGNTLACRLARLAQLAPADPVEGPTFCPPAGPGGSAGAGESESTACGTNCENYCLMRRSVCGEEDVDGCMRKCAALPDVGTYDVAEFSNGQDNIQCRLSHLVAAARYLRDGDVMMSKSHCGHSGIKSSSPCDIRGAIPKCNDFCKVAMGACTGENAIFESTQQCVAYCMALDSGPAMVTMPEDTQQVGTLRCLREGAYRALTEGPTFCPYAGPASDGCGGRCPSYCTLAKRSCSADFDAKYPGGITECTTKCGMLMGGNVGVPLSYAITGTFAGNTLQCRLVRLTKALAGDKTFCPAALGAAATACESPL